jgi:serine/threonine protein kinase
MPTPATFDEFLEVLGDSGILDEKRLEAFMEQWYVASSVPDDPRIFAEDMLKAGLITPFQKDNLLQGKRRGYIIADKYILLGHLGAGGMGSVFLCEHKVMRRRVALKVLPPALVAKDPEYLERFHREARAAAALDHPNIVRAFDVDHDEKFHFLVMEYVEGTSLHDLISKEGPLDIQLAADYIAQAATGLEHAHEAGLVHRDIKPSNLLVDRKGTVKILDMGLALFFQEKGESLTQQYDASAVLGTADYLAPEQVGDSHGVDIRADIYSLGLTFFFLLTGKSPYGEDGTVAQKLLWHQLRPAKSVREFRPEVPEGLAAIIAKMIAKKPGQRYQTPGEVAEALAEWAQGAADAVEAEEVPPASQETVEFTPAKADQPTPPVRRRASPPAIAADVDTEVSDSSGSRRTKTVRVPKSDPSHRQARPESKEKTGPRPRSSAKHRRPRAQAAEFWTRSRIIWAGTVGGLVLVLSTGALVWALVHSLRETRAAKDAAHVADTSPAIVPGVPNTGPNPSLVPSSSPKPPPEPPPKPPPTPEPKPMPSPPPVVVKNTQALGDYFPKPGAMLYYDFGDYSRGANVVVRRKWEVKDKGVIEATPIRTGVVEGHPLLEGGKVKWLSARPLKKELYSYSQTESHVEFGTDSAAREPILQLTAAEGDTWKSQMPNGDMKIYKVVKFDRYKEHPSVVIQDSVPYGDDAEIVTVRTYAKGIGEVARTVNLETKGKAAGKQLLAEMKLVDE